nr:hypothetical protein [Tanacetum cinerariifolium]
SDLLRRRTSQKVQVDDTSNSVVFEELAICVVDFDVHALRAGEEDAVSAVLTTVVEVDGMSSIQIGSSRSPVCITVPKLFTLFKCTSRVVRGSTYSACVVSSVQVEIVCRLSQAVQVGR